MNLRVNGEEITPEKLEAECRRLEISCARIPSTEPTPHRTEIRERAREIAIGRILLLQEARRRELTVPEVEMAAGLQGLIAAAGGAAAWTARVREKKIDYPLVWRELNDALLVEQLVREIIAPVAAPSEELLNARRNQALEAFIDQLRQDAMIEE